MATALDICNLALSHLGDDAGVASIDPPEGSVQAALCARFYPIARDETLSSHAWGFATRRISPPSVALPTTVTQWRYAYAVPSTCLQPLGVLAPDQLDEITRPYIVESTPAGVQVVYTNVDGATLRYVERVTDTARYEPMFITACSYLLASYLAGPIRKDPKVAASMLALHRAQLANAAVSDSNASAGERLRETHTPPWIRARHGRQYFGRRGSDPLPGTSWDF